MTSPTPLARRLGWISLFRLAVVTVLLGVSAFHEWATGTGGPGTLYGIILATYAVSVAYAVVLRLGRGLLALARVQVALDVVLAAGVVALTGRSESPFIFLFSLAPVNGAILLYRGGAFMATAFSLATYLPITCWPRAGRPPPLTLFLQASAFVITAALAAYLAEQLRSTGKRLAEREVDLAAITALHGSIVRSVSSGIVTTDAAGRVTYLNPAGEAITGLTLSDVRGEPASRWFAALRPTAGRGESELVNARGEQLRLGYTVFPLHEPGGAELGEAVIFQDLTRLRAMEEAMQRSARLADLGQLAAGLAHELRNPLASMSGSIELLRAGAELGSDDRRLMDIVLREAGRLDELVRRFLEFSRPSPPRPEEVDLARLAGETLDVFANDPGAARVEVVRALPATPAWCDAGQVRQVLWNLLANAAHAAKQRAVRRDAAQEGERTDPALGLLSSGRLTPRPNGDGLELTLGLERGARVEPSGGWEPSRISGTVTVSCGAEPDGGAWLSVEDDGPGIDAAQRERLFTPFHTTKAHGTGLGLATVQRIVDAHRGTVEVTAPVGGGARFTVRFPPRPA